MMTRRPGDTPPDFSGAKGRAWEAFTQLNPKDPAPDYTKLGSWLIEYPEPGIYFNYHLAFLFASSPDALAERAGATHTFQMIALDPANDYQIDLDDVPTFRPLGDDEPVDITDYPILPTNMRAITVAKAAIQQCIDGELIPDPTDKQRWTNFFRRQE